MADQIAGRESKTRVDRLFSSVIQIHHKVITTDREDSSLPIVRKDNVYFTQLYTRITI